VNKDNDLTEDENSVNFCIYFLVINSIINKVLWLAIKLICMQCWLQISICMLQEIYMQMRKLIIIIIINSYTLVTSIKSTHEKLYAICIEWTKLSEVENHLQSIQLLHAVETVSFQTMYQICSHWLHIKEWMF